MWITDSMPEIFVSWFSAMGTLATAPGTVLETAAAILPSITPETVVLVMGGGRSTELAAALAKGLAATS
jgi:hypothetical protein